MADSSIVVSVLPDFPRNKNDTFISSGYKMSEHGYRIPIIHRIPDLGVRIGTEVKKSAYSPIMVSIGPLHRREGHDHDHLQAMDDIKLSYMTELLSRVSSDKQEELKRSCVAAVSNLIADVRACYAEEIKLDDNKFARILLIDGCFIIELLLRWQERPRRNPEPIIHNNFRYLAVKQDLLLLENQIPFSVLQDLFKTVKSFDQNFPSSLTECLHSFFSNMLPETGKDDVTKEEEEYAKTVRHILDLLYKRYVKQHTENKDTKDEPDDTEKERWEDFKYSATELEMAGVKLIPGNGNDLFNVNFETDRHYCLWLCRRGRLEIPPFTIDDFTETFLRNIIAFEQTCPDIHRYFTSHAYLMYKLINTPEDVELLEEAGIISNGLGSRADVAALFNRICNNVSTGGFRFKKPCIDVSNYCKNKWPKFIVKLRRDYFYSPWAGCSVFAAFLLFAITILQTVYTLLSYY